MPLDWLKLLLNKATLGKHSEITGGTITMERNKAVVLLSAFLILLVLAAYSNVTQNSSAEEIGDSSAKSSQRTVTPESSVTTENSTAPKTETPSRSSEDSRAPESNKIKIALTFDDGPTSNTNRILDCLEKHGAKATFFIQGSYAVNDPDTVRRMDTLGMEVANHTYSHISLNDRNFNEFMAELDKAGNLIKELTGKHTTVLRFPGGALNYSDDVIKKIPFSIFNWTINTEDWRARSKQQIIDSIRGSGDGAILFLHDSPALTAEALEECIPQMIDEGYEFLTLSELAKANGITLTLGTVYDELTLK
jgi:peptidoglycan/xylan/chitin deacetylase (PgdA/CDA1 family)